MSSRLSNEALFTIDTIRESKCDIDFIDNSVITIHPYLDHERLNTLVGAAMGWLNKKSAVY